MKSCKEASRLISKSQDERLSLKEKIDLFMHLSICKSCVFASKQIKKMRIVFGDYTQSISDTPPNEEQSLSLEARLRIKSKIEKV